MAPHRTQARAQRGFTLIEMAIAVAIFGTLASGAILATSAWLAKQALDKTHKNLDRIESALTLYVVQNGDLPCPYDRTVANPTPMTCTGADAYAGLVPYRVLGLQRADVLDGWNRYITYAVNHDHADTATNVFENAITNSRITDLTATGSQIVVQDLDGSLCTASDPNCPAYVLISHGEAGRGGYTSPGPAPPDPPAACSGERLNSMAVTGFSATTFAAEALAGDNCFDHIVRFRTAAQIVRDAL